MKTCFVQKENREFFEQLKLTTYADFADLRGEVVSNSGKLPVHKIALGSDAEKRTFYLKKKNGGSRKALLKRIRRGVGLHGDAYIENAQVKRYEQAGIPVMHIAAWGEKYSFGRPIEGFLLVAEAEGDRLDRFIKQCTAKEKEQAFLRYGELIAQMHNNGICETLRIQDIICANHESLTLTVIDREYGIPKSRKLSEHNRINGLARTYLKILLALRSKTPMESEFNLLLNGYLHQHGNRGISLQAFNAQVKTEAENLTRESGKYQRFQWIFKS